MASKPIITGSFMDLRHINLWDAAWWTDECIFWKEDNWRALIRDMNEIGIDTVINTTSGFWGRPMFDGYEKQLGKKFKMGCDDPLGVVVDEVEKLGMKMFHGIGFRGRVSQVSDYRSMEKPWDENFFKWNRNLAEALCERFSDSPSFAGLYVANEINFNNEVCIELYEKYMKEYIRPAIGNEVKLLASPGYLGNHHKIELLSSQLERTSINILAPQDYGGRDLNIDKAIELVKRNTQGLVDAASTLENAGIELWSNCEVFNLEPSPDGRFYCTPAPFERIREQLKIQASAVKKIICYQYQGIMNKQTELVNIGHPDTQKLYSEYVDYMKSCYS